MWLVGCRWDMTWHEYGCIFVIASDNHTTSWYNIFTYRCVNTGACAMDAPAELLDSSMIGGRIQGDHKVWKQSRKWEWDYTHTHTLSVVSKSGTKRIGRPRCLSVCTCLRTLRTPLIWLVRKNGNLCGIVCNITMHIRRSCLNVTIFASANWVEANMWNCHQF